MPVSKGRHGDPPSVAPHALRDGWILVGRQAELACLGNLDRPCLGIGGAGSGKLALVNSTRM